MALYENTIKRESSLDKPDKIQEAYENMLMEERKFEFPAFQAKMKQFTNPKLFIQFRDTVLDSKPFKALTDNDQARVRKMFADRDKEKFGRLPEDTNPNEDILLEATTEAKFIRDEIKKRFKLTNRDVAVKAHNYSMGSSVRVEIKSPKALPFYNKIKEIGSSKERVHRDDFGNILGGGNTYIFVEIDWKFRDKLIKKIEMDFLKQVTGDYMNDIGTNTISMYGDYAIYKEKGKKEFHAIHKKKSSAGRALFSVIEAAGALLHLMLEYDDVTALKKLV